MWSKLLNVGVGVIAREYYNLNGCQYHNWQHVLSCYNYLEKNSVPYSEELDFAVMHHDIVYDSQPEKEIRSANLMISMYPDMSGAVDPILATIDHNIKDKDFNSLWMIRADLHQLADSRQALENYVKIMNESISLYGVDLQQFAAANYAFMNKLKVTVENNNRIQPDQFWLDVTRGIDETIALSQLYM